MLANTFGLILLGNSFHKAPTKILIIQKRKQILPEIITSIPTMITTTNLKFIKHNYKLLKY